MRFEYHPDVDALYIELNPGKERPEGRGSSVVVADSVVVDVDASGAPRGIDIYQDASKVVDLSKLEAEGPVFGLMPADDTERRVS